jgi:hypothetical protein
VQQVEQHLHVERVEKEQHLQDQDHQQQQTLEPQIEVVEVVEDFTQDQFVVLEQQVDQELSY